MRRARVVALMIAAATLLTSVEAEGQAAIHLSKALEYQLAERIWLQALIWRAGAFESVSQSEAVKDALRVLVALSYRAMPAPCQSVIEYSD